MACEDCKYWLIAENPSEFGYCHRYAPRPLICSADAEAEEWEAHRYAKWPDTNADDWCGEFEGKLQNIPFSLDGFPHGHAANIKRFLWMAEIAGTDSEWKERFPDLHPIETMDDFLSLKKEVVLSCPTIGILTWREIHLLQDKIRQKLKL